MIDIDDYAVETEDYHGYTLRLMRDDTAGNPVTEFTPLGTIVTWVTDTWGRTVQLDGTESIDRDRYGSPEELLADYRAAGMALYRPFHLDNYGSGGYSLDVDEPGAPLEEWHTGMIYVTRKTMLDEYGKGRRARITAKARSLASAYLKAEMREYAAWLGGEVYGYAVTAPDGEDVDSCWGYYGEDDYAMEEARRAADRHMAERAEKHELAMAAGL